MKNKKLTTNNDNINSEDEIFMLRAENTILKKELEPLYKFYYEISRTKQSMVNMNVPIYIIVNNLRRRFKQLQQTVNNKEL